MAEPEYPIVLGWSRGFVVAMWAFGVALELLLVGVMFFALGSSHSGFTRIIISFAILIAIIAAAGIRIVRMRVVIGPDAVTKYGFLFSTRIPRDAVRSVEPVMRTTYTNTGPRHYGVPLVHSLDGTMEISQLSCPQDQIAAQAQSLRWMLGLPTGVDSRLAQVAREHLAWPGE